MTTYTHWLTGDDFDRIANDQYDHIVIPQDLNQYEEEDTIIFRCGYDRRYVEITAIEEVGSLFSPSTKLTYSSVLNTFEGRLRKYMYEQLLRCSVHMD